METPLQNGNQLNLLNAFLFSFLNWNEKALVDLTRKILYIMILWRFHELFQKLFLLQHNTNRLNVLVCLAWNTQHEKLKVLFQVLLFVCFWKIFSVPFLFYQEWQTTLTHHLRKRSCTSWKRLELFNQHRKKQIFHQVHRGNPMNKPSGKKKAEKLKVIEKNVQCFHSFSNCLQFSYLLKEFNSAYVPFKTCFIKNCYKVQNQSRRVGFFLLKNISAQVPRTRRELFLIY